MIFSMCRVLPAYSDPKTLTFYKMSLMQVQNYSQGPGPLSVQLISHTLPSWISGHKSLW